MITFQDFEKEKEKDLLKFLIRAINEHVRSDLYKTAKDADEYDHQKNITINEYVQKIFTLTGTPVEDYTASNNKLSSNFFHRLNTQRCTYLLGNGVTFAKEGIKERLGKSFDTRLKELGYYALIHGVSFGFWSGEDLFCFPVTEFVPFYDEYTSALRGGIRFWRLDKDKPMIIVLYEEDGYTKYRTQTGLNSSNVEEIEPKRAYLNVVERSDIDGNVVVGQQNYSTLPIVPFWGSRLHQSTLVGIRQQIDSYDLIRSGFANDLSDCAQIYWLLGNAGGMSDAELARFRDRLKITHIAVADTDNSSVTPYTQEIPYQARETYLSGLRAGIYEDFGGLDVHTVAAGATNDHIDAAYQPMDEEADDFEYQAIDFVLGILRILDLEEVPTFKRNRISNENEQTQMVLSAAEYLDDETILSKLPFVTVDEITRILEKKQEEQEDRFEQQPAIQENENENENEGEERDVNEPS